MHERRGGTGGCEDEEVWQANLPLLPLRLPHPLSLRPPLLLLPPHLLLHHTIISSHSRAKRREP